MEQQQEHTVV